MWQHAPACRGAGALAGTTTVSPAKTSTCCGVGPTISTRPGSTPPNSFARTISPGRLAHNTNLSLKAILALGAYAQLCDRLELAKEAAGFWQTAREMAARWVHEADDGDHYRLAFDRPGTWSLKYNLVWDRLLELNLFPAEVTRRELASYRARMERYGLPLG